MPKKVTREEMITPLGHLYLGLNPNLDEATDDGEGVADDEQNIPAVDELHSVSPAHTAAKLVVEKLHVLLVREEEDAVQSHIKFEWITCYALPRTSALLLFF